MAAGNSVPIAMSAATGSVTAESGGCAEGQQGSEREYSQRHMPLVTSLHVGSSLASVCG
jgi:hypothetical protein